MKFYNRVTPTISGTKEISPDHGSGIVGCSSDSIKFRNKIGPVSNLELSVLISVPVQTIHSDQQKRKKKLNYSTKCLDF